MWRAESYVSTERVQAPALSSGLEVSLHRERTCGLDMILDGCINVSTYSRGRASADMSAYHSDNLAHVRHVWSILIGAVRARASCSMGIIRHNPFAGLDCACCAPSSRKEVVRQPLSNASRHAFLLACRQLQPKLQREVPREGLRRIIDEATIVQVRRAAPTIAPTSRRMAAGTSAGAAAADLLASMEQMQLCDDDAPV